MSMSGDMHSRDGKLFYLGEFCMERNNGERAIQLFIADVYAARWAVVLLVVYFAGMYACFGSLCPFTVLTGLPCPGCGLTRAGVMLLTLDFAGAFRIHPFIYGVVGSVVVFFIERFGLGKDEAVWALRLLIFCGIGMCLFYVWRMYRYFPDVEPMIYYHHNVLAVLRDVVGML